MLRPKRSRALVLSICACVPLLLGSLVRAAPYDPSAPDYTGRKGKTIYVSKLGDNSDGTSWAKAFRTIGAALAAVPDDQGGHCIVIRPDTYGEANVQPDFAGAAGAYNAIVGDFDGSRGSGATGWVVVDSGAPKVVVRPSPEIGAGKPTFLYPEGDPDKETGYKALDWWDPWRRDANSSSVVWDRWVFRNLYTTGGESGIGWEIGPKNGAPLSGLVEHCVCIGRFSGACVIAHTTRPGEPVTFRRCYLANLDWWGDAGAVYVRGEDASMPETPHAVFEDCTLVSPDNALQAGYPGVDDRFTRVSFKDCRLIVLNFSQPRGTPSSGIIRCGCKDGKQLQVDLEDCTLMGFKVFGTRSGKISYSLKGRVAAYVQYQQPMPDGFERLRYWPTELFEAIGPPETGLKNQ